MAKTRQQKEGIVQSLTDKLNKAKSVVFADYRGLSMKQLSDLRNKLSDLNAEFTITKNTLLKRAFPDSSLITNHPSLFTNPTATLLSYDDEISPIKILVKTLKDSAIGQIKMGFMDSQPLDEAQILKLSTLPTKDELRGQTVGVLVAPLQGMLSVLQGNLRNLVYALSEIKEKRSAVA